MKCSLKLIMSIKGHFRSNNFLRIILGYLHFITVKLSCIEYSFVLEIIEYTFMKELSWISISNFESLQCASFALYYRTFMITKFEIFTAAEKFLTDCFFLQNVCIGITVRMFTVVLFQIFPLLPVQCFLPVVTSITVATDCGEMALYVRGAPPAAASTDTRQPGPGHRPPAQPDNQRDCLQSLLADAADKTGSIRGLSRVNFPANEFLRRPWPPIGFRDVPWVWPTTGWGFIGALLIIYYLWV